MSMTLEQALGQVRSAENLWRQTLAQHRLAPPDLGFADRLADQADAARKTQNAYAQAAAMPGLAWNPLPHARREPPYELRPDSGRRGPQEVWQRYDEANQALSDALEGPSLDAIASAYGALADSLIALAEAVRDEDGIGDGVARAAGSRRRKA
jgi:hypothetical protein